MKCVNCKCTVEAVSELTGICIECFNESYFDEYELERDGYELEYETFEELTDEYRMEEEALFVDDIDHCAFELMANAGSIANFITDRRAHV